MSVHCSPRLVSRSRAASWMRFCLMDMMLVRTHRHGK